MGVLCALLLKYAGFLPNGAEEWGPLLLLECSGLSPLPRTPFHLAYVQLESVFDPCPDSDLFFLFVEGEEPW